MTDAARVAVVTGAGGDLGQAIARRLRAAGYRLALLDRDEQAAFAAADAIGAGAVGFAADQTDAQAVEDAVENIARAFGRIDVVAANAGYAKFSSLLDMAPHVWDRHIAINLSGTFHVCQYAGRIMAASKQGGAIVVTSSSLALAHADETAAYCTAKAALLPLVRSMAAELGIYRIRVNAILPGVVESGMTRAMLEQPGVREDLLQATPIGRLGTPDDIAAAVAFLCSPDADFITGGTLTVDGGQSIYGEPRWRRQDRAVPFAPQCVADLGARR